MRPVRGQAGEPTRYINPRSSVVRRELYTVQSIFHSLRPCMRPCGVFQLFLHLNPFGFGIQIPLKRQEREKSWLLCPSVRPTRNVSIILMNEWIKCITRHVYVIPTVYYRSVLEILLFFQFSSINLLFFGSLIPWSLVRRSFQIIFNTAHGASRLSVRQPSFREETFWRSEASSVLAIEDENWEKDWVSRLSCLGKKRRSVVSRRNTGIGILLVVRVIFRQTLNSEKVTSIFLVQFSRLEYRGSQEGSLGSDGKWINGQASELASQEGRKGARANDEVCSQMKESYGASIRVEKLRKIWMRNFYPELSTNKENKPSKVTLQYLQLGNY